MPTFKQKQVIENISENIGTKGELLRSVGYSQSVSETPSRVLKSKGIQSLVEKAEEIGLDDELCLHKVKEAITSRNLPLAVNTIFNFWKVKYPNEKPTVAIQNNVNIELKPEELKEEVIYAIKNHPEWHDEIRGLI